AAVEIRHLARPDDIELENFEIRLDVILDVRAREIDQMRFPAIGATTQLPHDGEALACIGRALQIVRELKEALQKPRLAVEAVVGQNGRGARRSCKAQRRQPSYRSPPRQHFMAR